MRDAVLGGVALGMQLLSSHPQIPFYTFVLVGVFALYGIVRAYLRSPTAPLNAAMRAALFPVVTILIGIGLSAPQLVTTFELIPLSRREQGLPLGYQEYGSLPPTEALTLIFPRLFLWPLDIWRSPPLYDVFHFYIGLIPLVCAALSLLRRRESMVRMCWLLVLVSVLLALGQYTPVYSWVAFLPVISFFRIPSRWLFVTARFSTGVLSGSWCFCSWRSSKNTS